MSELHYHRLICNQCHYARVEPPRARLGFTRCMECAKSTPEQPTRTVAPMHKSNYMLITNLDDLKGLNNKGGLIK